MKRSVLLEKSGSWGRNSHRLFPGPFTHLSPPSLCVFLGFCCCGFKRVWSSGRTIERWWPLGAGAKEPWRVQLGLPLLPTPSLSSAPNALHAQLGPFQVKSGWSRDQRKHFWKIIPCCRKWAIIKSIKHHSYEPPPDIEITLFYRTLLWNEMPSLPTSLHWIKIHSELLRVRSSARHRGETQRWNDKMMSPALNVLGRGWWREGV